MRIGEFAERHDLTQDAIRHYLDLGLLMTRKRGGQFHFNAEDDQVIEKIKKLKSLQFSLAEIQEILSYERLEGNDTNDFRKYYLSYLKIKSEQIFSEQQKFEAIHNRLQNIIEHVSVGEKNEMYPLGLPIQAMELLYCYRCRNSLTIFGGVMKNNMLFEADIQCDCGYKAKIQEGIYIDQSLSETKSSYQPGPTKEVYLKAASPKHVNYLYRSMNVLLAQLNDFSHGKKIILELDYCPGRLLMNNANYLTHTSYILVCNDLKKIHKIKRELEMKQQSLQIVFLCCEINQMPIRPASIDIVLDNCASYHFARKTNQLIFELISPLLKIDGLLMGIYPQLGTNNYGYSTKGALGLFMKKDQILKKIDNAHIKQMNTLDIGPIIDNNPYMLEEMKNKEFYYTFYVGKKSTTLTTDHFNLTKPTQRSELLVSL